MIKRPALIVTALLLTLYAPFASLDRAVAQTGHVGGPIYGNVEVNLDVIDQLSRPAPHARPASASRVPSVAQSIPTQAHDTSSGLYQQKKALDDLHAKYFPEEYKKTQIARQKETEKLKAEKERKAQALRKRKAHASIPAPPNPPNRALASKPRALSPPHMTSSRNNGKNNKVIQGKKLVSITYIDEDIELNPQVKDRLASNYIPKLQAERQKRIGLHSFSSTEKRSPKEARRISLERGIALKNFLASKGVDEGRIDIFPATGKNEKSFSDWIDIIL